MDINYWQNYYKLHKTNAQNSLYKKSAQAENERNTFIYEDYYSILKRDSITLRTHTLQNHSFYTHPFLQQFGGAA